MATGIIGVKGGNNLIIPYASATKRTKTISLAKTTDITVDTLASTYTIDGAIATFWAGSDGKWYMHSEGVITCNDSSIIGINISFLNVVFQNNGAISASIPVNVIVWKGEWATAVGAAAQGLNLLRVTHPSYTVQNYAWDFTIELASEPTTYTIPANMEGVVDASVYVTPADATHSGVVTTGAQTFAGDKTLNGESILLSGSTPTIAAHSTYDGYSCYIELSAPSNKWDLAANWGVSGKPFYIRRDGSSRIIMMETSTEIVGRTDGNPVGLGKIGEVVYGSSTGVPLTYRTWKTVATITLTKGNWMLLGGRIGFGGSAQKLRGIYGVFSDTINATIPNDYWSQIAWGDTGISIGPVLYVDPSQAPESNTRVPVYQNCNIADPVWPLGPNMSPIIVSGSSQDFYLNAFAAWDDAATVSAFGYLCAMRIG